MIEPDWPAALERWSTIIANIIAIATFTLARGPLIRWAKDLRRAVDAMRFEGAEDIRIPHRQMVLESPAGESCWQVHWTRGDGSDPILLTVRITSPRLRWHLHWRPKARSVRVVGELRFLKTKSGTALAEISSVHHIVDGGLPAWIGRLLFG